MSLLSFFICYVQHLLYNLCHSGIKVTQGLLKMSPQIHKKKILHRQLGPLCGSSSPFSPLSSRGLNPIKPVYDPDQPDGRLNLTACVFNQLHQYTSRPGHRGYCYAELAVFFRSGGRKHRQ